MHSGDCSDTDLNISYSSSDTSVVTVASNGLLTAIAPGSATITASCAGETDTCPVTVSEVPADTYRVTPSSTGGSCTNKAEYLGISENSYSDTTPFALDLTTGTHNLYVKATREHYEDKKWIQEVSGETTITLEDSPSGCEWTPITYTLTVNGNGGTVKYRINNGTQRTYSSALTLNDGDTVKLSATRSGYTINRWEDVSTDRTPLSPSNNEFTMIKDTSINITWTEDTPEYVSVTSVAITDKPTSNTITWDCSSTQTYELGVTVLPVNATNHDNITWTTSNINVADIEGDIQGGQIRVKGVGTTKITATGADGKSDNFTLTVSRPALTSFSLNKSSMSLTVGENETLSVKASSVRPTCAEVGNLTWSSSNPAKATVDTNGKVTAVAAGTTTITAKSSNNIQASCSVTISEPEPVVTPATVNVNFTSPSDGDGIVTIGNDTYEHGDDITGYNVGDSFEWSASAPGYETKTGTYTIRNAEEQWNISLVKSTIAVQSVVMNCHEGSIVVGDQITLSATVYPANATDKTITWVQGQNPKGTISGNTFTATSSGIALIHAEAGGVSSNECGITIDPRPVSVEDISIDSCPGTIAQGLTNVYLTATIDPSDATNKNVTWSSSNSNIIAVEQTNDGRGHLIVKNTAGTATITVTTEDGNYQASCTIIVPSTAIEFALRNQTSSGNKIYYTIGDNIDESEWSETWNSLNYGATTGTNPPLTISPGESLCITSENYPEDIQLEVNGTNRDDTNGFITMTYSELQQAAGYSNTYIVTFVREH